MLIEHVEPHSIATSPELARTTTVFEADIIESETDGQRHILYLKHEVIGAESIAPQTYRFGRVLSGRLGTRSRSSLRQVSRIAIGFESVKEADSRCGAPHAS